MTVHMEQSTPPTRMSRNDVSWIPHMTVPWIRMLQCLHHGLDEATDIYFLWLGERIPQESAKTRRTPVQPPYRIFPMPDISLNDVSTSMTVHMETVYAADKNVTSSVSWNPRRCHG
jgi:hypothetical protein